MLAIVGGSGRLPDRLCEAYRDSLRYCPVGTTFGTGRFAAEAFRYEKLGSLVQELRSAGVDQVSFAGALRRPELDIGALDGFTREALMEIGPTLARGDDAVLRGVVAVFERAGFAIVGAHALLPELLPPTGVITSAHPEADDHSDADRARAVLQALGPLDVGQACVVAAGQVLAIEAVSGTDWMLRTLSGDVPGRPHAPSGVLCKAPKAGQDRRIDMPTIGPATVRAAKEAKLKGIAIDMDGVILLDRDEAVAVAEDAGLFIWVRDP